MYDVLIISGANHYTVVIRGPSINFKPLFPSLEVRSPLRLNRVSPDGYLEDQEIELPAA